MSFRVHFFFCFQPSRSCASPARRRNNSASSIKDQRMDNSSPGWSWLERWMAAKPWENRLMDEIQNDSSETSFSRKSEDNIASIYSYSSINDSVKVRKNNVSTRIHAKPPVVNQITRSSSAPSSESLYDESSECTPSSTVSPIPLSSNTFMLDKVEERYNRNPSYMNLTESTKAKQKVDRHFSAHNMRRHTVENQFHMLSMPLSDGDAKSSAGSNPSFNFCRDDELRIQGH